MIRKIWKSRNKGDIWSRLLEISIYYVENLEEDLSRVKNSTNKNSEAGKYFTFFRNKTKVI